MPDTRMYNTVQISNEPMMPTGMSRWGFYILVSGIATGVMSYKDLNVPDPIAVAADRAGLGWMASLIKLGAIAGLSSVILVMLLGQSRVFYSMSRDGLLP